MGSYTFPYSYILYHAGNNEVYPIGEVASCSEANGFEQGFNVMLDHIEPEEWALGWLPTQLFDGEATQALLCEGMTILRALSAGKQEHQVGFFSINSAPTTYKKLLAQVREAIDRHPAHHKLKTGEIMISYMPPEALDRIRTHIPEATIHA